MEKSAVVVPKGQEVLYNNFHFAPAVKDKDHLYCSGVIGMGPDGKVSSDADTQFTQAFESIKGVLEAAGLSFPLSISPHSMWACRRACARL